MSKILGGLDENGAFIQRWFFRMDSSDDQEELNAILRDPSYFSATLKGYDEEYAEVIIRPDWS